MKIKFVKRRFYRAKLQEIDDIVDMDVKDAMAYIDSGSAVYATPHKRVVEAAEEKIKDDDYDDKTVAELIEIAKDLGVPCYGRKAELIDRLKKHEPESEANGE